MKKSLILLCVVWVTCHMLFPFLFFVLIPDGTVGCQGVVTEQLAPEKQAFSDQFRDNLSKAIEIVAQENETTESLIIVLTAIIGLITVLFPALSIFLQLRNDKSVELTIKARSGEIHNEIIELFKEKELVQTKRMNELQEKVLEATKIDNLKQTAEIKKSLDYHIDGLISDRSDKINRELNDSILKIKNDLKKEATEIENTLSNMQDELFQYMKIEDTISSRIRDKKFQAIQSHWLREISQWNISNTPDTHSLSALLSRHVEFIFSLEQICSTSTHTVVDGLFNLEDHVDEVPRGDMRNLITELKRQQRLNERDVFMPLKRLELALQCKE